MDKVFVPGAELILQNHQQSKTIRPLRLSYFLALSRTPHALLDLASPGLAALLCLGTFPATDVIVIGMITAFAGYTAVYALNDIVDYRVDRETSPVRASAEDAANDLDSLFARHPLAQGLVGYKAALVWTLFWGVMSITGAWRLNPLCLLIFLAASGLEIFYCLLLKVTWLRTVVSGFVKTSGPLAAVFAVNPQPSSVFLLTLFLWFFFWEIGGQNVPNDLSDVEGDRQLQAVTIPVRFSIRASVLLIFCSLIISCLLGIALPFVATGKPDLFYAVGAALSGGFMLLLPAFDLLRLPSPERAFQLFNRASYYPLVLLVLLSLRLLIG